MNSAAHSESASGSARTQPFILDWLAVLFWVYCAALMAGINVFDFACSFWRR